MNFKKPKSKKDQLSNLPSTSWNKAQDKKGEGEGDSVKEDSARLKQQEREEYNNSRTTLEGSTSNQSEPLLLEKALISNSSNIERSVFRSQTSGYLSSSHQGLDNKRTKLSSSLLNNNIKGDNNDNSNNRRDRTSASSSIQRVDSLDNSSESANDCYDSCNCHLKFKKALTKRRNSSVTSSKMSKSSQLIKECFIAELVGTFLLVVIGDGVIASYVVTKHQVDLFTACFAFGVGAMIATFASAKISGAHINPAASLAFALDGKLKWKLVPVYICAQYLGGFLAALVLFVNYSEAISALDGGSRSTFGSNNSTGHIFATYPASWVSIWGSLLDQIIGTAVLLFSICAVTDKNNAGLEDRHQPLCVAFTIGLICVAFSANCGAIFNPARDLAPRLLTLIFGYSQSFEPIQSIYWLSAGVVGPHIGAIVGVFAYKILIGNSLIQKRELELAAMSVLDEEQHQSKAQRHTMGLKFKEQQHQQHQDNQAVYLNTVDVNYGASGQR